MTHILALDQGTTSSRAVVFDASGRPVARAQREFTQHFPQAGWVEHDPEEIWASQRAVMREALDAAGLRDENVSAVGIANQRETTVLWDRATGTPVHSAIVWQDRRTSGVCDALRDAGHADTITQKTGLVLDAYFSGTKLKWLLDHVPGARARAERGELAFGTIDAWLLWKLTGGAVHATDVSNASRTLLFDIRSCAWDDELLRLFDVPREVLPEVVDSSGVVGEVARELPGTGAPVAGIAGDQQAALFGQLCTSPGMAKNTYGTGCFLLMNTGEEAHTSDRRLLSTVAWRRAGMAPQYALEGSVFVAGSLIQWLRDGLGIIGSSSEIDAQAASVDDAGGVVIVPAFAGLGAPHWDQYARGSMHGLTRGSTKAHVCRAALDAIACSVVDLVRAMESDTGVELEELRVDGGASSSDLLMQIQADLLQRPVVRPANVESTSTGAAYLAGLGAGVWPSIDEMTSCWTADRRFVPSRTEAEVEHALSRWHRAVERSLAWEEPD